MQIVDSYPVIVTDALDACRDFYTRWFGFDVAFQATWFVLLTQPGSPATSIAFMRRNTRRPHRHRAPTAVTGRS